VKRTLNLFLLVLVLACGVSIWWAKGQPLPSWWDSGEVRRDAPSLEESDPQLPAAQLRVLNATEIPGLAAEVALRIPGLGCVVQGVGNAAAWPGSPSLLINRRLPRGQALELAERLGGIPVIREWDGRGAEDAVLVLGDDHDRILKAAGR
jgi:hypothetical protein